MAKRQTFVFLFLNICQVRPLSDGLHPTPPMGWTSWNTFFEENSQEKMISQVRDRFELRSRIFMVCI